MHDPDIPVGSQQPGDLYELADKIDRLAPIAVVRLKARNEIELLVLILVHIERRSYPSAVVPVIGADQQYLFGNGAGNHG